MAASQNTNSHESFHHTIDAERKRNAELLDENQELRQQLEQVKLELKLERQDKFATHRQKQAAPDAQVPVPSEPPVSSPKKRGAPVGHPGWFRAWPTEYDWAVEVDAPSRCPHCHGLVTLNCALDPSRHLQEDILEGVYRVVLYRHVAARCAACDLQVQKAGKGEILGSHVGPNLRSKAIFLRNVIGIRYRKDMRGERTQLLSGSATSSRNGKPRRPTFAACSPLPPSFLVEQLG